MDTIENDAPMHRPKPADCSETVRKTVCVEAKVTIDPHVDVGSIQYHCYDKPCDGPVDARECPKPQDSCSFVVKKLICVEIPLTFSASTKVDPLGIVCDVEDDCCPPDCNPVPPIQ